MHLRELRNFLAVAEQGNFTKAAAQLHIAQSALSRQIIKLERTFGVALFERTSKGVVLTPAGRVLLDRARNWDLDMEATRREMGAASGTVTGTLRIAVQHWVSTRVIPDVVKAYRARFPGVFLSIVDALSGSITDGLLEERIDVAIVETPADQYNGLSVTPLWCENLRLFGPADAAGTALFQRSYASIADTADLPFIAPNQDHAIRRIIDAAFGRHHLAFSPVMEANGASMIFGLVKAGLGFALMPMSSAQDLLRRGEIAVVDFKPLIHRTTSVVTRTALARERTVVPFIEIVTANLSSLIKAEEYGPVAFYAQPGAAPRPTRDAALRAWGSPEPGGRTGIGSTRRDA